MEKINEFGENNMARSDMKEESEFCSSNLLCPQCEKENMEMDPLMNLVCPNCGFSTGGGST